jgi:uncharacterized repeat protein (TIGR01451 family)
MRSERASTCRRTLMGLGLALVAWGCVGVAQASASADLRLALTSPLGGMVVGSQADLTIDVDNFGPDPTGGTTTVTDALPAGLSPVSATGDGWTCALGQTVTCTTTASVAAGTSLPTITLTVAVGAAALPAVTDVATVANPADPNTANDSDSIVAPVHIDHDVAVAVDPLGTFSVDQAEQVRLNVSNVGTQTTLAPTTVENVLPPSVTFVSADGDDWTCALAAGAPGHLGCSTTALVAGGHPFPRITLLVRPTIDAWPSFVDTATVASPGDEFLGNNAASATVRISGQGPPDLALRISGGGLIVGEDSRFTLYLSRRGATPVGTTTVSTLLPPSLLPLAVRAIGWTCALGQRITCTRSGSVFSAITITVRPAIEALPSVTVSATVHNDADRNSANDTATAILRARRVMLRRMLVSPRWRAGKGPRTLDGVTITSGFPKATLTARCAAGCGRGALLGKAVVGKRGRPVLLRFRHPLLARRGVVLAIVERYPGHISRLQRFGLARAGRAGWRLRGLRG